ncbi:discoidin domain-containing protein [Luteimonas sp. Y-2-2-4F]|nr:discoidin domain-containing protein [Luteimonas sp. Y-2-2-4F]MCD9031286.1 discoidin domain-containing protein [Luteimonas sp. Y-2-2-4F]
MGIVFVQRSPPGPSGALRARRLRAWRLLLLLSAGLLAAGARAGDGLPPRSEWRASASSVQVDALSPRHAIDGDPATRWGGAFSPQHWLQVDLGREADVGGVAIHWDSGFAVSWTIQTSADGDRWGVAYTSTDSRGDTDYVVFPARRARYLRLASMPRTADWGVSVFEFEPIAAARAPRAHGLAAGVDGAALFGASGPARGELAQAGAAPGTRRLEIDLPRGDAIAGLEVWWDGPRDGARLEMRDEAGAWSALAEDPGGLGERSYLAAERVRTPRALRLTVGEAGGRPPAIARMRLLGPKQVLTPTRRYEILAARAHRALFPSSLHGQQVYWTTVGVPAGRQKSLFDEYGNLEPFKGGPMLQAIWRDASGRAAVADNDPARRHALREGWMPMPSVAWTAQPGVEVRNEAFAVEHGGQPVTLARYRVANTGTTPVEGTLWLAVRPLQVNPPWQHGGWSPIRRIAIEGEAAHPRVRVDGRTLLASLTPADEAGAAPFGAHGETEVTASAAAGRAPPARQAEDPAGLASGLLGYPLRLAPGAHADVVVALPLGTQALDPVQGELPEPPPLDLGALRAGRDDAGAAFDAAAEAVAAQWRDRFAPLDLALPDDDLVHMLRAQGAYMLINQTGPAMQPGPRNYNRSFIRDGAATAAILLRMGQPRVARDYLRWYTDHALNPNGMVSPILNEDGSINRGFGSDIEYDSQGQYIQLVADVARLDGGPESVREYLPAVIQAMRFLQALRERTMGPGYMAGHPAPARFHGILAPSISHEGYSSPTHSYWDDYFGIKGWHDGAWLAEALGDAGTARWAREQGAALSDSVAASIRATIAWKGSDFIPSSADLGDSDPTSVSIALDPTGARHVLPERELETTFDRYLAEQVRTRGAPDALWAYTPYELRNVLTYVHLDRPAEAQELLDGFLAHRRPLAWQMWPEVVHSRERYPGYIGDMPHTWIGAEYARTLFGMLLHEGDDGLRLLPGAPPDWLAGDGIALRALPTAFGSLTLRARQDAATLHLDLGDGLPADLPVQVWWPSRTRPQRVLVDGADARDYDARRIVLPRPFRTLEARW